MRARSCNKKNGKNCGNRGGEQPSRWLANDREESIKRRDGPSHASERGSAGDINPAEADFSFFSEAIKHSSQRGLDAPRPSS